MEKLNLKLVPQEDSSHPNPPSSDTACPYNTCDGDGYIHFDLDGYSTSKFCQCIRDKTKIKLLGERFYNVRLETLEPRNPKQLKLKTFLTKSPERGVFIFDTKGGTGKTHFLAAMYNHWDDKKKRIKYLEDGMLKDELRNAELNNDYTIFNDIVNSYDVIMLDDVGKQQMSPFYRSALYRFFNEIYKQRRYIFITANDSLAALGGDEYWGYHVARRVEDLCAVVEF